jgi:ABC-type glycerol-3-phosphate transport system permease component
MPLKKKHVFQIFRVLILIIISLTVLYPAAWLIANSLKSRELLVNDSWNLIPDPPIWSNYLDAWRIGTIGNSFRNSLIVTASSVVLLIMAAFLASYAIARLKFNGKNIIFVTMLAMWMIPGQALIIPLYKIESSLKILNTYLGLILPYATGGLPFAVFVLTTFIRTIPWEIEEATIIDGASRIRIIFQIIAPLAVPGIATVVIFTFMGNWNELFLAMIMLTNPKLRTLPIAIMNFSGLWGYVDYSRLFAAIVIISLPVVIVYVIFQKQFIKGLTAGAVKL